MDPRLINVLRETPAFLAGQAMMNFLIGFRRMGAAVRRRTKSPLGFVFVLKRAFDDLERAAKGWAEEAREKVKNVTRRVRPQRRTASYRARLLRREAQREEAERLRTRAAMIRHYAGSPAPSDDDSGDEVASTMEEAIRRDRADPTPPKSMRMRIAGASGSLGAGLIRHESRIRSVAQMGSSAFGLVSSGAQAASAATGVTGGMMSAGLMASSKVMAYTTGAVVTAGTAATTLAAASGVGLPVALVGAAVTGAVATVGGSASVGLAMSSYGVKLLTRTAQTPMKLTSVSATLCSRAVRDCSVILAGFTSLVSEMAENSSDAAMEHNRRKLELGSKVLRLLEKAEALISTVSTGS